MTYPYEGPVIPGSYLYDGASSGSSSEASPVPGSYYRYGGPRIPGSYHYGSHSNFSEFYSVSGGRLQRRPRNPDKIDSFDNILRAPYRKLQQANPEFSPESFVPFAKMGVPKLLAKAQISEAQSSILVLPKAPKAPKYDDEGIPDEVIMLALM